MKKDLLFLRMNCAIFVLALGCILPLRGQEAASSGSNAARSIVPVGVLAFQDESGGGGANLGDRITQRLRHRLFVNYKDLLPKNMGADSGAGARPGMTVEEIVVLGKQFGVKFMVRGGVLPLGLEPGETENKARVWLFADVVSMDNSRVESVRVEGEGSQGSGLPAVGSAFEGVDLNAPDFARTAVGQAMLSAIDQLAEAIHAKVMAPAAEAPVVTAETPATEGTPVTEEAAQTAETPVEGGEQWVDESANQAAQSDEELQQLISDAQAVLAAGGDPGLLTQVSQALDNLNSALAIKANMLQSGEDTQQADSDIGARKEELRAAISVASQSASFGQPTDMTGQPGGPGILAQADATAGTAISLVQKIKDLQAMLWGSSAETQAETQGELPPEAYGEAPPAEEPLGEVGGVVVNEEGEPVEGAEVTETETGESTTTESNGSYLIPHIPIGTLARPVVVIGGKTTSAGTVQVLPGRRAVADFLLNKKGTGAGSGILSSTVKGRAVKGTGGILKGTLTDSKGTPLPRVLLTVKNVGAVRTNSKGEFMFVNTPAGSHQLVIQPVGLPNQTAQVKVMSGKTSVSTLKLNGALPPIMAKPPVGRMVTPGSGSVLQGQVKDSQKKPLPGARVTATRETNSLTVSAGSGGKYQIRDLAAGSYRILVSKPGFQTARQDVTIRADKREKRDFELRQTSALVENMRATGLARFGSLKGRVVQGPDRRIVTGALVEVRAVGSSAPPITAYSDRGGEYTLSLQSGRYDLKASKRSASASVNDVRVKAGATIRQDLTLQAIAVSGPGTGVGGILGDQKSGVGGRAGSIRAAETVHLGTGQLHGIVRNSRDRKPIAGALVLLDGRGAVRTDSNGAYQLRNLVLGNHRIAVQLDGFVAQDKKTDVKAGDASLDFALSPVMQVVQPSVGQISRPRVQAAPPGQLSGRVLDGKTGRTLGGVTVNVSGVGSTATDANGQYVFSQVAPGSHQISVSRSGYQGQQTSIRVESGRRATLDFQLTPILVAPRVTPLKRP